MAAPRSVILFLLIISNILFTIILQRLMIKRLNDETILCPIFLFLQSKICHILWLFYKYVFDDENQL